MNRTAVKAAAFAVLLLIGREVCAEQLSVLKHVRSSVRGGDCRVTFAFEGDVRFSSEQTEGDRSGSSSRKRDRQRPGRSLGRISASGPVQSIAFTRSADGSLLATLTLAKGSSYRCVSPAGGQELYVDVHGEAGGSSAIAGSSVPKQNRAAAATRSKRFHDVGGACTNTGCRCFCGELTDGGRTRTCRACGCSRSQHRPFCCGLTETHTSRSHESE